MDIGGSTFIPDVSVSTLTGFSLMASNDFILSEPNFWKSLGFGYNQSSQTKYQKRLHDSFKQGHKVKEFATQQKIL